MKQCIHLNTIHLVSISTEREAALSPWKICVWLCAHWPHETTWTSNAGLYWMFFFFFFWDFCKWMLMQSCMNFGIGVGIGSSTTRPTQVPTWSHFEITQHCHSRRTEWDALSSVRYSFPVICSGGFIIQRCFSLAVVWERLCEMLQPDWAE